ncbi:MAG: sulfite exporter TauE/SafE family protein [Burkholderiales bacterium]|nr:MAG: sulfite exporter TauE/SafE family protein [Burkholderiales bacterium]
MDPMLIAALLVLGAFTGLAAGLLGIGGGMLMVPFMSMVLDAVGVPHDEVVKVAIATSLTTIVFTSVSSVRAHQRRGVVRWDIVRALAPGILVGSLLAAQVAHAVPGRALAAFFGLFIGWSALRMLSSRPPAPDRDLPGAPGMFAAGGVIGALSALLGAGGAFMTIPYLVRRNVPLIGAVASSAACGFPIALAGAAGYAWAGRHVALPGGTLGYVYLPALACVSAASVLTAPLGARLAHALPVRTLRRIFAGLLSALATYMLWRAVRGA